MKFVVDVLHQWASKAGRTSSHEVIIFDSTGMVLQDVTMATIIYQKAVKNGIGTVMEFTG